MLKLKSKMVGRQQGFTLVELMIVVAIIGLLAAIAIPQFLRFSFASKRAEARVLLSAVRNGQNAYFSSNDHFAGSIAPTAVADVNNEIGLGSITMGKFYTMNFLTTNLDPNNNPKGTLDYLALASADIDGDGDLADDRFFVKNQYPLFPSVGNNQVEQFRDDLTNRVIIAP